MTRDDRVHTLEARGFTPRQAAFLTLVLLHSGSFLRRQYAEFRGVVDGARTTDFVQALMHRHLATRTVYARQTYVYHLHSRPLYSLIGEENSRLRRQAEPAALTQKLMTLDVVIAHRTTPCLATEADKVAYFTEVRKVPTSDLPGRVYRSTRPNGPSTTRYFVDRVPVLLGDDPTFVYVPGASPPGEFAAFLRAYAPLFLRLGAVKILFCTSEEDRATKAYRLCERRFPSAPTSYQLSGRYLALAYFRQRKQYEAHEFRWFTQEALRRYHEDERHYRAAGYQAWYERWCREGDSAEPYDPDVDGGIAGRPKVTFERFPLRHSYPIFGDFPHGARADRSALQRA